MAREAGIVGRRLGHSVEAIFGHDGGRIRNRGWLADVNEA
jgi:hypothetical protein